MNRRLRNTGIALLLALPVFIYSCLDGIGWNAGWKTLLSIAILAPIAEELIFRGVLQDYLMAKQLKPLAAIIIVSLIFALVHFALAGQSSRLLVFFPSLALGWHYQQERSLPLVMLIHAIYNVSVFL